jgi:dTDP-4-dehydrorhamnose reductase
MKVLVTGSNGQLGNEIRLIAKLHKECEFIFTDKNELDIANRSSLDLFFKNNSIDYIINCAAYTAVDDAESYTKLANEINHIAVRQLAEIAKLRNIKLIHISTDYVFDGSLYKPYQETDNTNPQSVYGLTKLSGENSLLEISPEAIIIRTSFLYSSFGNNFVKTMLELGRTKNKISVVCDQIGSPTYAKDLADIILKIISHKAITNCYKPPQIFHYSNQGEVSWYDFAKKIFQLGDILCEIKPIKSLEYKTKAVRPMYSVLNKEKIKNTFDIVIPKWEDSLIQCLKKIKEN